MSRAATSTPPPPFFHQKHATPSVRHGSKGGGAPPPAACGFQQRFKKPKEKTPLKASAVAPHSVAPMSASDMLGMATPKAGPDPMSRANSASIVEVDDDASSIITSTPSLATNHSVDSFGTTIATPASTPSLYGEVVNVTMPQPVASPRLWVSGIGKMARAATGMMSSFRTRPRDGETPRMVSSPRPVTQSPVPPPQLSPVVPLSPYVAPSPRSTPYVAPSPAMSPATPMSPMAFVLTPAPEVTEMLEPEPLPPHALPPAVAHPHNMPPALTPESPNIDNPAEALRRYEWAEEQRRQVTEFARLCSQWPQSSYNQAKFGPNGCTHTQYLPQSWANPRHVVRVMQRQAALERSMCAEETTFFPAAPRSTRSSSTTDDDSEPSVYSFVSSHSSVATTMSRGTNKDLQAQLCAAVWAATSTKVITSEEALKATEQKTAEDLHAAMSSPMVDAWRGEESIVSVSSAVSVVSVVSEESKTTSAWASLACSTKSLGELDQMADLTTTDKMDIDEPEVLAFLPHVGGSHPSPSGTPSPRPSSCPAKRPMSMIAVDDEDKRRKVDDMVVDDSTPVFSDEPAALPASMSASVPNLRVATATIAGHVVKTSETHPIVISPFIPTEIMSTLGKYLVTIPTDANKPLLLNSDIDVPALLLACAPPSQCPSEAGLVASTPASGGLQKTLVANVYRPRNGTRKPTRLGNMLLSSCPGKRLRMDGPVKGRGPVCRDLRADLRRIKGEGVGAVICCLDDDELDLLGVPWHYYREVASEVGLDILRLPMPDGFTPVSLQLFDAQVTLIAQRYTLQGVNVLVHCRGGIGRAGLTACAWAIKMGFVQPHPSLVKSTNKPESTPSPSSRSKKSKSHSSQTHPVVPANEEERKIVMSIVERVIAMIRSRRGLKSIESMEQVQFLSTYVTWLRECTA